VALGALHWAERLAASGQAELFLLQVVQPLASVFTPRPTLPLLAAAKREEQLEVRAATQALSNQLHELHGRGLSGGRYVEVGSPALKIVEFIQAHDIDLVIMGTHGRGGLPRAILGSVADEVRRLATVPVLLVPRDSPLPLGQPSVLICLDQSPEAESAMAAGLQLAAGLGASAELFEVTDSVRESLFATSYLHTRAQAARGSGVHITCVSGEGYPGPTILLQADIMQASVIAMASRGRSGMARVLLGSVASYVLEHSSVPVLLAHRGGTAQQGEPEPQVQAVSRRA